MSSPDTPSEAATHHQSSSTVLPEETKRPFTSQPSRRLSSASGKSSAPATNPTDHAPPLATCLSHSHDTPLAAYASSHVQIDDAIYDRIPAHRKRIIVALISYCSFLAPMSSTTVLSAVPEVAAEFRTTGSIVNISNALYMLFMGVSPCFWGPASQIFGRRWVCISTAFLFACCSLGTALSPNLASFFVFRVLTAFEGTSFLIVGAAVIGDIYRPTERATAMGWFLSGTLIGPTFGPFIGGIIVTYTSWRVIFYLQVGLATLATVLAFFLLPETIHQTKTHLLSGLPIRKQVTVLARLTNPWRVVALFKYPPLTLISLCSSSLVWNMYSLLTPIRYVLNPRFHLTSPMQGGLFYLAPGAGYLAGTFVGGRWADHTTKKWIAIRGERIAEDRLRSGIPFLGGVIPASVLIYGWSVDRAVGGIPVPVICLFVQGVAQLFCFPSLNTYCLDVLPDQGAEVIAGNYMVRYLFGALGTAVVLPAVQQIGVGWFSTISAGFMVVAALAAAATVRWGKAWRDAVDDKRRVARRDEAERRMEEEREEEAGHTAAIVAESATEKV